jgi:hypothetical protein
MGTSGIAGSSCMLRPQCEVSHFVRIGPREGRDRDRVKAASTYITLDLNDLVRIQSLNQLSDRPLSATVTLFGFSCVDGVSWPSCEWLDPRPQEALGSDLDGQCKLLSINKGDSRPGLVSTWGSQLAYDSGLDKRTVSPSCRQEIPGIRLISEHRVERSWTNVSPSA